MCIGNEFNIVRVLFHTYILYNMINISGYDGQSQEHRIIFDYIDTILILLNI